MRTTLTIDDDVLLAARAMAESQRRSVGEVVSELARKALRPTEAAPKVLNGVPLLPKRNLASPITLEMVNKLRDELP